jgi:1-acyl-sn-glycerol-3-phosphate acyltransferase
MKNISAWILKIFGWKIYGDFPPLKKFVVIVVPHTTNWDFVLGVLVRSAKGLKVNYVGKEALFKAPWGFIFRQLGGFPIEHTGNQNQVEAIVEYANTHEEFRLAIAPEGTRSKVDKWRTGFYWIARGAEIPIVMISFDIKNKEMKFSEPFYTTEDKDADFTFIKSFYE